MRISDWSSDVCSSDLLERTGAKPTPQLPITTVVTPCQLVGERRESQIDCPSKCVWISTKPGVTSKTSASSSSDPRPVTAPLSTMLSPQIATSAFNHLPPQPSTQVTPTHTSEGRRA